MIRRKDKNNGYAFILVIFAITIIAIISAVVLTLIDLSLDRRRFCATIYEMSHLKTAIVGNPSLISNEARTSFGFVGDMGNLPNTLDDLVNQGSQPDFSVDATTGISMGWNGPYLSQEFSEETDGYKTDAWGTEYNYDEATGTIVSAGSDRSFGSGSSYAQDLTKTIATSEYLANISGSIKDSSGNPITNSNWVNITLYCPSAGQEVSTTASVATDAIYSFNNIPVGIRRVVMRPLVGNLGEETTHLLNVQPGNNNIDLALHGNEDGTLYYVQGSSRTRPTGQRVVEIDIGNSDSSNNIVICGMQISWEGGRSWGHREPQLRRIYRGGTTYWRAQTINDGKSGEFIDLDTNIVIQDDSTLDNLRFEFGRPIQVGGSRRRRGRLVWLSINMRSTSFNIISRFGGNITDFRGKDRSISFATP